MDSEFTQALRAFEQGPDPASAARALTLSARAAQEAPSVVRWALRLECWRTLGTELQDLVARVVANAVEAEGFAFVGLREFALGEAKQRLATFERQGEGYSLVPGGRVPVGFDLRGYVPGDYPLRDVRRFADRMLGEERADPERCLEIVHELFAAGFASERLVDVPGLLVAQEAHPWPGWEALGAAEDATRAEQEAALRSYRRGGLRLLSGDEWEHLCGGGARTLFRWGAHAPAVEGPYSATEFTLHRAANAFGLRFPADTYQTELCTPYAVRGGDGGSLECGGGSFFLPWLTLASAWEPTRGSLGLDEAAGLETFEPRLRLARDVP